MCYTTCKFLWLPRRKKRTLLFLLGLVVTYMNGLLTFLPGNNSTVTVERPLTHIQIAAYNNCVLISHRHDLKPVAEVYRTQNRSLVNNSKCRIPDIPVESSWGKELPAEEKCEINSNLSSLTYVDYQNVIINTTVLEQMGYNLGWVTCCYRAVLHPTECGKMGYATTLTLDNQHCMSSECHLMAMITQPIAPSIYVTCSHATTLKRFYEMYHLVTVLPTDDPVIQRKLLYWTNKGNRTTPPWNILILGIDSTSRLNAHRHLPKSLRILRELGAVEMRGYTKAGQRDTISLLTSYSVEEFQRNCNASLDECSWIWKEFSAHKYLTAYFEDDATVSHLNSYKTDFLHKPVDLYSRLGIHFGGRCMGHQTTQQVILEHVTHLTRLSWENEVPFFAISWMSDRNGSSLSSGMDSTMARTLAKLNESRLLENTLLLVVSTHGYRHHPGDAEHWFEDKLPLLFLRLPESLVERYPEANTAVLHNAHQLVTAFDLHVTLKNVLKMSAKKNSSTASLSSATETQKQERGLTMLKLLPERTCDEAGVPPEYCVCDPLTLETFNRSMIQLVAQSIVDKVNAVLPNNLCAKLSVELVTGHAEVASRSPGVKNYVIGLKVSPGGLEFEGVVTIAKTVEWMILPKTLTQVSTIRRLNPVKKLDYGCLETINTLNTNLYLYCYCL